MIPEAIRITNYEVLGKLPDPFTFADGSKVKTQADWELRRKELIATACDLQYGTMPPQPEFLEITPLFIRGFGKRSSYRVTTGTREHPVSFHMYVYPPETPGKHPVVIDGDSCYWYKPENASIPQMFTEKGIYFVLFDRTDIVPDMQGVPCKPGDQRNCEIHKAYPDKNFTDIAAWAWGFSRTLDAMIQLGFADEEHVVFTGLSRGGKAALLAGALDERAWLVNPEAPCAGGSCYRLKVSAITQDGEEKRSEQLEDILNNFPRWFTDEMQTYIGRVDELPFDEHYLKALIAPRIYFDSEAASDMWASPVGAYMTNIAAAEVFKFLGVPENMNWYYRSGYHDQTPEDFGMLLNLIENRLHNTPLSERFGNIPFEKPDPIFAWRAPAILS